MTYDFPRTMVAEAAVLSGHDSAFSAEYSTLVTEAANQNINTRLGLSPFVRKSVAESAEESAIKEYCPNDYARFATDERGIRWSAKNRAIVSLWRENHLLAYGWAGPEVNKAIPEAPITTAFRTTAEGSSVAREIQAIQPEFRLGYLLGRFVILTAEHYGAKRGDISLETWQSNTRALRLYEKLGFVLRTESEIEERSTLHKVGDTIYGHIVYPGNEKFKPQRVADTRLHYVLE